MEDLISRLENVQQIISLLDSNEKESFIDGIKDTVQTMCILTDQIETDVSELNLDPKLIEEKNAEFYRQKIMAKAIFAHYWGLVTFLNGKSLSELKDLDKVRNIVSDNYQI